MLPSLWVLHDGGSHFSSLVTVSLGSAGWGGGTRHFSSLLTVSQVLQDRGGTRHFSCFITFSRVPHDGGKDVPFLQSCNLLSGSA